MHADQSSSGFIVREGPARAAVAGHGRDAPRVALVRSVSEAGEHLRGADHFEGITGILGNGARAVLVHPEDAPQPLGYVAARASKVHRLRHGPSRKGLVRESLLGPPLRRATPELALRRRVPRHDPHVAAAAPAPRPAVGARGAQRRLLVRRIGRRHRRCQLRRRRHRRSSRRRQHRHGPGGVAEGRGGGGAAELAQGQGAVRLRADVVRIQQQRRGIAWLSAHSSNSGGNGGGGARRHCQKRPSQQRSEPTSFGGRHADGSATTPNSSHSSRPATT
mmetsp:Transcript_32182/g.85717  ORF Transcript_32182/g.85717 Transcript_32182/m.85717 type:complete len:277 (-) Transcript_32182:19-849(-)